MLLQLIIFRHANLRAVAKIEEKEAFLNNDDLGDSTAAVESAPNNLTLHGGHRFCSIQDSLLPAAVRREQLQAPDQ